MELFRLIRLSHLEKNPKKAESCKCDLIDHNPCLTKFLKNIICQTNRGPGALECSRVSCDPERIEVLLELNGPTVADRPYMGDLCFAFFSLPVKPEVIVAESHDSLAAVALRDFVRVQDEFVETRRQAFENA